MNDEMANRVAQGIITGLMLTGLFSLIFYILRTIENKKNIPSNTSTKIKTKYFQTYFVQPIENKGTRRLIITLGLLVPLLVSVIIYYTDARLIENSYGEILRIYDESVFFKSLFVTFISYWLCYLIIVWIYKGFQESKRK